MNPLRSLLLLLVVLLTSGCSKVAHLDQLLTLKSFSETQAATSKDVDRKNADFDILLAMVQSGEVARFKKQKEIINHFGTPILSREKLENGQKIEEWIYRYQTKFFDSPKVYLQFDESKSLIKWFATDVKPAT